jgi:hypothetical protein
MLFLILLLLFVKKLSYIIRNMINGKFTVTYLVKHHGYKLLKMKVVQDHKCFTLE